MAQVQRFSGNLYTSPDGKVFPHPQTLPSSPQTALHLSHTALPGVPEVQTGCNVSSSSASALPSLWHDAYDSSSCPLSWGMDRVLILVSLTAPSRQGVRIQPAVKEGVCVPLSASPCWFLEGELQLVMLRLAGRWCQRARERLSSGSRSCLQPQTSSHPGLGFSEEAAPHYPE